MRIRATASAQGHRVERTMGALDVSDFDDLGLWFRTDRVADGSDARPFFLEVRLGSGQLPIGSPENAWHRLVPLPETNVWRYVPLGLDDLPPTVSSGLSRIRFTCIDASVPFEMHVDRILALRDELLADVDSALVARLGGKVEVAGAPVPALIEPSAVPGGPFLRIRNYAARPAPERSPAGGTRTDYVEQGFSIRPPSVPFDLFYEIDAVADDRGDAARVLEFVLGDLTPVSTLDVAGRPLTVEWVESPPLGPATPSQPTVHIRIATSQQARAAREVAVPPFNRVDVEVDARASA